MRRRSAWDGGARAVGGWRLAQDSSEISDKMRSLCQRIGPGWRPLVDHDSGRGSVGRGEPSQSRGMEQELRIIGACEEGWEERELPLPNLPSVEHHVLTGQFVFMLIISDQAFLRGDSADDLLFLLLGAIVEVRMSGDLQQSELGSFQSELLILQQIIADPIAQVLTISEDPQPFLCHDGSPSH